jgi:type I restriction enzyme S subunit
MSSNVVRILKVGDFAQVKGGKRMPAGTSLVSQKTQHPYLRIVDFKDGAIDKSNLQYVPDNIFPSISRYIISSEDVYISIVGTIGLVGKVPLELNGANLTENAAKICRLDSTVINRDFLSYFLRSEMGQRAINSMTVGSTQPKLALFRIEQIEVPCPSLEVQASIASVLNGLDDRITLLRETNTTLEAIAQALFKSWFVDFDPVRAKFEGKLPEGIDEATAALFPEAFEESELGLVPSGWGVKKFGDFIDRQSVGKKFDQKTALTDGAVPILDQGKSGIIGFHNESPGVKASLENPVIVFANHTCYMRLICFDFSAIQNVLPFIGKEVDTIWAYYATKDRIKFSEYKGHWPDFAIEKAVVPPKLLTKLYKDAVSPLVHRIRLNELQANTLSELRDTLLPRLISGQLRIADAEAELEKVTA